MNAPLAHHGLAAALPFFVPTAVVLIVIGVLIWRDRHTPDPAPDPSVDFAADKPAGGDQPPASPERDEQHEQPPPA